MNKFGKIVGGNLLILLIYSLCIQIFCTSYDLFIIPVMMILFQVVLNLVLSVAQFGKGDRELGKAYLLSSGLVLGIGFSICSVPLMK